MDKDEQIRQSHEKFIRKVVGASTMLAIVESVDAGQLTATLKDDDTGLQYFDVRLRPVIDGNEGFTIIPKAGTWALAIRIEDDEDWMIVSVGEADKYRMKKGSDSLKDVLQLTIEAVMQIMVVQGNNPDFLKLQQALTKLNNLM